MTPCLIAIAGMSGAGKTALATALAERLAAQSAIIALDSYYHPLAHLPVAERATRNYDHPDALDWPLLAEHLSSLLQGEPIAGPVYLFDEHTRAPHTSHVDPQPYLIVEGILALHQPEIRSLAGLKVFVTTPEDECLRRRLVRDVHERGRTRASVLDQYNATVLPMAREFVLPSSAHADLIVSGAQPLDHSVATVLTRVAHALMRAASRLIATPRPPPLDSP